jgi:hypothetical protein
VVNVLKERTRAEADPKRRRNAVREEFESQTFYKVSII